MSRSWLVLAVATASMVGACESPTNVAATPGELPTGLRLSGAQPKIDLCHRTGSETNPWVLLSVAEPSVQTHVDQHGDQFPGDRIGDTDYVLDDACVPQFEPAEAPCDIGDIGEPVICDGGDDLPDLPPPPPPSLP